MPFRGSPAKGGTSIVNRRLPLRLALVVVLAGCTGSESAAPGPQPEPAITQPVVAAQDGSWRRIAEAPIPPAGGMAAVWTGRHLVVWGGQSDDDRRPAAAGAAYEPATERWDVLPEAPIEGRFGTSAVWTGREVLFWGGQGAGGTTFADGAAYDPAGRTWRALPAAPIGPRSGHQAVWTGQEMIVWGGYARCCPIDSVLHDPAAAAYDPASDEWRRIARLPSPWSGDDGTAVTVTDGSRPLVWREGRLAAYDDIADRWGEIPGAPPAPPPDPGQPVTATTADPFALGVVAAGELFVWEGSSGRLTGVAYRPAGSADGAGSARPEGGGAWRRTARLEAQPGAAITAGGPDRIYAAAGQSTRFLEYRIGDDRWDELPRPPIHSRSGATLVWTGTALLAWGGMGDEAPEMDGAIWTCC